MNIEDEIRAIQLRNQSVEADKAWEISWTRRFMIAISTYVVVLLFFFATRTPRALIGALVPTMGFLLSTATLSMGKRVWLKVFKRGA